MNKTVKVTLKVLEDFACKYPDTKDYIKERLNSGRGNLFISLFAVVWCQMSDALSFWANKYSTFSCTSCSVLESGQMKYLNIYD